MAKQLIYEDARKALQHGDQLADTVKIDSTTIDSEEYQR